MVMQIVPMAMMSIKIAPGDLALKMISPVIMDCVSHAGTGELRIKQFPSKPQMSMGAELTYPLAMVATMLRVHGIFNDL